MNVHTLSLALKAPKEKAFAFLSDVENLPKWAVGFCRKLRRDDGRWRVTTPDGEIDFEIRADAATGVLDMITVPAPGQRMTWPARVVAGPGGGSLFLMTAIQYPGVPDEVFAHQCDTLANTEFALIRRHVDGA